MDEAGGRLPEDAVSGVGAQACGLAWSPRPTSSVRMAKLVADTASPGGPMPAEQRHVRTRATSERCYCLSDGIWTGGCGRLMRTAHL